MFTQCPQCGSYFRVREAQLNAANGKVRCSLCTATFNARDHLHEQLPRRDELTAEQDSDTTTDEAVVARDPRTPDLFDEQPPAASAQDETRPEAPARDHGNDLPDPDTAMEAPAWLLESDRVQHPESRALLWTLGSVVMLILLGLQLLHAERDYWRDHPTLGHWVTAAYDSLGQPLPEPRSLEALAIMRADIAGRVDDPGVLRVTAVLENSSPEPQPLPAIYIRLEDRWGMNMGYGFFLPSEWIHPDSRDTALERGQIEAGGRLPLRVALNDPTQEAVSFHMEPCWIEDEGFACKPQRGGAAFVR